jgi:hypothetical protein
VNAEPKQSGIYTSQCDQDEFVDLVLDQKRGGVFVDIGCGDPVIHSNTCFLEKERGWRGVAIDKVDFRQSRDWELHRPLTAFYPKDVTTFRRKDLGAALSKGHHITSVDYLSIDCDEHSLAALKVFPFLDYPFFKYLPSVITIEHDAYRFGDTLREPQRKLLKGLGYLLVCADVVCCYGPFEDWWMSPETFNRTPCWCAELTHQEIVSRLRKGLKEGK